MAEEVKSAFRIILLGGTCSNGKSVLVHKFATGNYESQPSTIGVACTYHIIELDGTKVKLQLLDTASQEKYREIYPHYMTGMLGLILTYDITDHSTFVDLNLLDSIIEQWVPPDANRILLGLKCDLEAKREVTLEEAEEYAAKFGMKVMEVSSLSGKNVDEAFFTLARDIKRRLDANRSKTSSIISLKQPKTSSIFPFLQSKTKTVGYKTILEQTNEDSISQIFHPTMVKQSKQINVTEELQLLGLDTVNDFRDILHLGKYKCFWNRIYLVGQYGVGKSTLTRILLGELIPDIRESTDGIWIFIGRAGMNIDKKEWLYLPKGNAAIDIIASMLLSLKSESSSTKKDVSIEPLPTSDTPEIKLSKDIDQSQEKDNIVPEAEAITTSEPPVTQDKRYKELFQEIAGSQISNKKIQKLVIQAIKEGKYKQMIVPFDLWDFGGQKEFYLTHQLFITSRGIFVLMFNGSHDLNVDISKLQDHFSKPSVAVYLLHWVNSILTYCKKSSHGFPRILFVATHKDKIRKSRVEIQRRKLSESIGELFKSHAGLKHLEFSPLIFINATDARDPEMDILRNRLMQRAFEHPRWGEEMPTAWVPLELQISQQAQEGKHILSREQLETLNALNSPMVLSERQLETFLKVQHSLGKLIYFDDVNLRNFIIINPVYLVEVLRSIVTDRQFWPKGKYFQEILHTLHQTGTIDKKDIFALWDQECFKHILPYKEYMLDILIHLDIIVAPHATEDEDTSSLYDKARYMIPAMICKNNDTRYLSKCCRADNTIMMAYRFVEEVIPPALAYRFLASFVTMWDVKNYDGNRMLFRDIAVVEVDEFHDVAVQVKGNRVVINLIHSENSDSIMPTLASSVQECLTAAIHRISEFYSILSEDESTPIPENRFCMPFEIDYGVICHSFFRKSICYFQQKNLPNLQNQPWICPHGTAHNINKLCLWFADKKSQERCTDACNGLGKLELTQCPLNKHIRRLAAEISPSKCREIAVHLGVTVNTWENLEYQFQHQNPDDLKFMALYHWKEKSGDPSFDGIIAAVENCDIDRHLLCQVFRDIVPTTDISDDDLQKVPSSDVLQYVSNHIGDSCMQLGIELGMDVSDIQQIQYQMKNKLLEQTREILRRWKKHQTKPTVMILVKALYRIGKGGCLHGIRI